MYSTRKQVYVCQVGMVKLVVRKCAVLAILFLSLFLVSCSSETEESVREKFDKIIEGDLEAIVDGLSEATILDSPYTNLIDWEKYEDGQFHYRAVVEFYFYRTLPKKIIRKYRYNAAEKKWERYYNQYHSVRGSLSSEVHPKTVDSVRNILK